MSLLYKSSKFQSTGFYSFLQLASSAIHSQPDLNLVEECGVWISQAFVVLHSDMSVRAQTTNKQQTIIHDQLRLSKLERWDSDGQLGKENTEDSLYLADNIAGAVFMRELKT